MPFLENELPQFVSSRAFEDLKNDFCNEIENEHMSIDTMSIGQKYLIAFRVVAHNDFRHLFVLISKQNNNENIAMLRWIDEHGHFDSKFSFAEIRHLLGEVAFRISSGVWYSLNELFVPALHYIDFDTNYCNGVALHTVKELVECVTVEMKPSSHNV